MRFQTAVFASSLAFALLAGNPQSSFGQPPLPPTPVGGGEEMYLSYCAACHGRDGRGDGPAVAALKTPAQDLTSLAKANNGKFPGERVKASIRGDLLVVAHGSKDMPVWGPLFRYLGGGSRGEVNVRIDNLTRYIQSLQESAP